MTDTIFALATARGKAGVAVIRVSGPRSFEVARQLSGADPQPGSVQYRAFRDHLGGVIDHGLMLGFRDGASFTGEQTVEFQIHGSTATVKAMMNALDHAGLRIAEPGEFTRRALYNGRMDLTQVEGLADLIDAETDLQRKMALRVSGGEATAMIAGWRKDLIRAAALIEATIDFAEEELPESVNDEVLSLIDRVGEQLGKEIRGFHSAERIREGFEVAIVGPPNIGKSTLLNRLAGREAAITSDIAGTTRDIIEVRLDMDGLPVTWLDTAGLRPSHDEIELIGMERARQRAQDADLRVFLVSPDEEPAMAPQDDDIVVVSKGDLYPEKGTISAKTGAGIDQLIENVSNILSERTANAALMSHKRHQDSLKTAAEALDRAENQVKSENGLPEVAAEELRRAIHQLELVIGYVDVEHFLDEIFSSFCIGK